MRTQEKASSAQGQQPRWCGEMAGKPYSSILAGLPQVVAVLVSLLKEIFDESAYDRFLERNQISSSTMAYAAFREENDQLKAQRPKCC